MARRLGNAATLGAALRAWHWTNWHPSNVIERLAATSEMIALAEHQRDDVAALIGYTWRVRLAARPECVEITLRRGE